VIGRGYIKESKLKEIHEKMVKELKEYGAWVDGIYYCPHHPDDNCDCRKPKPGLILQAAKEHNIELRNSWMIGDEDKDIQAGKAAGCKTIKLNNNLRLLQVVLELIRKE
jgi:histidinol-phosphate phosphatase family protein